VIISVHIPKCGGTSFRHVLQEIYGDGLWLNYGEIFSQPQARPDLLPRGIQCIHGHFLGDAFDDLAPQPRRVTWLRHPVERVVSNYYHFIRSPDLRDACCRELLEKDLSLEEFAELDWMRNEATRYLADKPVEAFEFIGILERFGDSLRVFGETFGVPVPREPPRVNVNPARTGETYPLSPRTYEHILGLNLRDLVTYDLAVAMLDCRVVRSQPQAV
jgi:Sulfotransferase family